MSLNPQSLVKLKIHGKRDLTQGRSIHLAPIYQTPHGRGSVNLVTPSTRSFSGFGQCIWPLDVPPRLYKHSLMQNTPHLRKLYYSGPQGGALAWCRITLGKSQYSLSRPRNQGHLHRSQQASKPNHPLGAGLPGPAKGKKHAAKWSLQLI